MKRGINKVTLMGNVGDDPRVNQINDTTKVARFPLATNEVYFDKEGNEVRKTEWHNVVFWNKAADIVEEEEAVALEPADHYSAGPRSTVILISQP